MPKQQINNKLTLTAKLPRIKLIGKKAKTRFVNK